MRFDVRREERSVEDELGRASPGRNCAGVPEKGGATERVSSRKGHDWVVVVVDGGGIDTTWGQRAERKLAEGEEDGDAVGWRPGGEGGTGRGEESGEVTQGRCESAGDGNFVKAKNSRREARKG